MKQNFRGSWHVRALLLLCLTFQIPWGGELSHAAQTAQQNTIRIGNVTNLKELIRQIEAQTSYKVSYQGNLADNITIKADPSKHNVEELLADALRGTGISYVIRYNTIILTQEQPRAEAAQQASQTRHIAGRVIDAETKEPIIGATVWVKDSALGTNTNVDGAFDYTFTGHYGYIAVSYIGYQTQEFPVTNLPKVIELSAGNELDEVVVVGYGTQKKASVVGSIASVSVNDIRMPTAKISNNLAGQLAGVISVQRSGEPGASSTFWIRGISTFGSSTTPLVLVDGIERDLDLVDIEDIKDFSILKDAAATAIYGVRGANGVILITTREGIVGKPQINIRFEAGMVQPTKVPDMLDAVQFAELWNAAAGSEVYTPEVIQKYRDGSDPDLYPNVDWVDYLYKDLSFNERVNVNVTGGGSTAKYYISGGFFNEDGLFARDNMKEYNTSVFYRKFNFRSNVEVQLHKYTKLNINLATTFERKNEPGTAASKIWDYAVKSAPNVFPAVYSNGLLPGPGANNGENPYVLLTQTGYREKFYNTAQSLFSLTQDLGDWVTKGLTVTVKGSFDAKNYNHLARTKTPPQYMASGRDEFGDLILQQKVIGADNLTYAESHSGYRSVYLEGAFPLPAVAAQQRGNRQVAARTGPSLPAPGYRRTYHVQLRQPLFHRRQLRLQRLGKLLAGQTVRILSGGSRRLRDLQREVLRTGAGRDRPAQNQGLLRYRGQRQDRHGRQRAPLHLQRNGRSGQLLQLRYEHPILCRHTARRLGKPQRRLGRGAQTQRGRRPVAVQQAENIGRLFQRKARRHLSGTCVDSRLRRSEHPAVGEHRQDAQQRRRRFAGISPDDRPRPASDRAR